MTSLIMFALTFITIYVQPQGVFSTHGTFPTTTLLYKFSVIWKPQHIMLMKVRQAGWRDISSGLS
jgi:hypothetical protein